MITHSIFLIGLMGAGKTTIGRRLALTLRREFLDSDHEIEQRAGASIPLIFELEGEAGFRAREKAIIAELTQQPGIVLATGGGAMLNPETRALMKTHSVSVWMRADLKVIAERVQRRDTRPLLRGRDPLEALSQLAEARYPIYAQADLTVDVGGGSHGQAVEAIYRELRRHAREESKR